MGTKLNIGIFVPWITTGRGGTEHIGSLMANLMSEYGHCVSVHTFDDNKGPPLWPLDSGVDFFHHAENPNSEADEYSKSLLKKLDIDIIVGLHITREFSRYTYYADSLGIPVILSEHHDPYVPRTLGLHSRIERRRTFSKATKIHLINRDFLKTLPRTLRHKAVIVPNTIDSPGNPYKKSNAGKDNPIVLSVARLTPFKNTINLIHSFARASAKYPEWRLVVAGYGETLPKLKQAAETGGICEKVSFLGRVSDTYPLYENADIFVIPSLREGFPLASLEAMSHGLPVLGYRRCPGLNQQIENSKNGFLCWGGKTLGGLPGKLGLLMGNDSLRAEMGRYSVEKFSRDYSPEKIGRQWEKMILDTYRDFT